MLKNQNNGGGIVKFTNPYLLLIAAAMFWGGNFVIGRGFADVLPPFTLSVMRWSIALLIITPIGWKQFTTNRKLFYTHWKPIIWMSLTGIAGFNTMLYIAVHYTTSINAALVNASTPVIILVLSIFFLKEQLTPSQIFGIMISIIGVLFIISRGSLAVLLTFSINQGELWMLGAVGMWSIYSVLVKRYSAIFPEYGLFMVSIVIGLLLLIPFAAYEWIVGHPMVWSFKTIFGLAYVGIFASIVAFLAWNRAVADIGPGKASPFLNLIPVFAALFAILFLDEVLVWSQIVGGILALCGVLITTNIFKRGSKRKSSAEVKHHLPYP